MSRHISFKVTNIVDDHNMRNVFWEMGGTEKYQKGKLYKSLTCRVKYVSFKSHHAMHMACISVQCCHIKTPHHHYQHRKNHLIESPSKCKSNVQLLEDMPL